MKRSAARWGKKVNEEENREMSFMTAVPPAQNCVPHISSYEMNPETNSVQPTYI
jgi:hypothetical protein